MAAPRPGSQDIPDRRAPRRRGMGENPRAPRRPARSAARVISPSGAGARQSFGPRGDAMGSGGAPEADTTIIMTSL